MKALELLKQHQYADDCLDGLMAKELNEAITELEELKNRNCNECRHYEKDDTYPSICWECSRYYADKFEKRINNEKF